MLNVSSTLVGGFEIGNNLDRAEHSAQAVLHIAEVQGRAKFGGGLGAVRTGIALFWATKIIPCTVCKSRKAS